MTCCGGARDAPEFDPVDEGPSEADLDRFGGETRLCPACHTEVWDGASICPECGLILDDAPMRSGGLRRTVFTVGLILAGVAFILVFVL